MAAKKAVIFIDNGYFIKLCWDMKRTRTSFEKITKYIAKKSGVKDFDVYIYDCMPYQSRSPTTREGQMFARKDKFFTALRKKGFIIRFGKLQKYHNKYKQKRVDTLWTADVSKLVIAKKINKAIIISGDSDFVPGVEVANSAGVDTILFYGESKNTSASRELRKICKKSYKLTLGIFDRCQMGEF